MTSSRRSGTPRSSEPVDGLVVGAIVGPHGIRGDVKLRPLTEFPERIPQLKQLRLRMPDGTEDIRKILKVRSQHDMFLVLFEGAQTRDDAEGLRGAQAVISMEDAAPLPEGRYYEHQILGLRVITPDDEELGVVRQVMPGASNDVYVAGKYLIPATHDAILRLAPEDGVIVVRSKEYLEGEEVR